MPRGEAHTLSGVGQSSSLRMPQREVPVAPFSIGTGALGHLRQPGRWRCAVVWLQPMQLPQGPTGLTPRWAEARGQLAKRLPLWHRPRRGHTVERAGWQARRGYGVGRGRRHVQLTHLLSHISRDARNGRRPCRHHAVRVVDALHAARTASCLLGNGADGVDGLLEVPGHALAGAAYAALQVANVVGVADGARGVASRWGAWRAVSTSCSTCAKLAAPCGGRPGRRCCGSSLALRRGSCPRWRVASALASALAAARCLGAMGAETALLSSCGTGKRSGE